MTIRPEVGWRFRGPDEVRRFFAALPADARVILGSYVDDEDREIGMAEVPELLDEALRDGHKWFELIDVHRRWAVDLRWHGDDDWSASLAGELAEWRPSGDEATLEDIVFRGVGREGRIPKGLPEAAYAPSLSDPGLVRGVRRQPAPNRLEFFERYVVDEVWVDAGGVATWQGFLSPNERPVGGRELQAWVAEAPEDVVDVQPGDSGQNLRTRREFLDLIWESVEET